MLVRHIRDINTLKVIGTIGPRTGDNLDHIPQLDQKVYIRGKQFLGFEAGKPVFTYPEPREFRVVAVTPYGAYVKKWRDKDIKSALEKYLGLKS